MTGDNVVTFQIDPSTGKLSLAGDPLEIPGPSCIEPA